MRVPSVKTLSEVFSEPKAARLILKMDRAQLLAIPVCEGLQHTSYGRQQTYRLRMVALNALESGFYGIECCETIDGEYAEYLNAGDMYNATLLRWRGNYRVTTVGDFVEVMERNGVKFK